jgi:hypothetical protein
MKKVIKDIVCCSFEDIKDYWDLKFFIDGKHIKDFSIDERIKIIKKYGLLKGNNIVVPKGFELVKRKTYKTIEEFTFRNNNLLLITDLFFNGDEKEYIF